MKLVGVDSSFNKADRIYELGYSVDDEHLKFTGRLTDKTTAGYDRGVSPYILGRLVSILREEDNEDIVIFTWGGPEGIAIIKRIQLMGLKNVTVIDLQESLNPIITSVKLDDFRLLLGIEIEKTKDPVTDGELILEIGRAVIEARPELIYLTNIQLALKWLGDKRSIFDIETPLRKRVDLFKGYVDAVRNHVRSYEAKLKGKEFNEAYDILLDDYINTHKDNSNLNRKSLLYKNIMEKRENPNYKASVILSAFKMLSVTMTVISKIKNTDSDYELTINAAETLRLVKTLEIYTLYRTMYNPRYSECRTIGDYHKKIMGVKQHESKNILGSLQTPLVR